METRACEKALRERLQETLEFNGLRQDFLEIENQNEAAKFYATVLLESFPIRTTIFLEYSSP